ncbi:MAG: HD domain-containing protein [Lachnospiraceae bacterium]|nr:HD domain-containing protein [Lachnospiraceae bacterium]
MIKKLTIDKKDLNRIYCILFGILVNVALSFILYKFEVPLFLDTIGTILVTMLGGSFLGIATGVLSNTVSALFNDISIYYGILNALIAICTVHFFRKGKFKKIKGIILFILVSALITGVLGAVIQTLLIGTPQYRSIEETVRLLSESTGINRVISFMIVNFFLNIVDKGISVGLAIFLYRIFPQHQREAIYSSEWRQKPFTLDDIKRVRELKGNKVQHSLKGRMSVLLIFAALFLSFVMVWISVQLYYSNTKKEYTEQALNAVRFAAEIIDPDKVDTYLEKGKMAYTYVETENMLYRIRRNAPGVQFLYVVKIKPDGCHFIFDLETGGTPAFQPGDVVGFEEAFLPYVDDLLQGKEIEPIESDDIWGWVLTIYHPVKDERGNTTCYVGADVSMQFLSSYTRSFLLRALLAFSGFFVLILAYGMRVTRTYLIYPINSMAAVARGFSSDSDDQTALDDDVKKLESLEIKTGDEIEALYRVLCKMTADTTQQMKDIRHYSEAVAQMQNGLIITMADMVENRDSDTGAHVQKTSEYVRIVLEGLKKKGYYKDKLTDKYISDVVMSAPLHDVGKINIPDAILNKPGKLTPEEFEIMKTHTTVGKRIMEHAISTVQGENYLKEARNMAAYHHEKWDGSGYPDGLYGEVIPLSARVMAVADVFDALSSKRVYKPAMPMEKALSILQEGSGTHFDPKCIEAFMDSLDEVMVVYKKYQEI